MYRPFNREMATQLIPLQTNEVQQLRGVLLGFLVGYFFVGFGWRLAQKNNPPLTY